MKQSEQAQKRALQIQALEWMARLEKLIPLDQGEDDRFAELCDANDIEGLKRFTQVMKWRASSYELVYAAACEIEAAKAK